MDTLGRHLIVEMSGCTAARLSDGWFIKRNMEAAAKAAGATVVASKFYHFDPNGISGVVIVAESHLSIHTWPERGYASLDFYTCGNLDPSKAMLFMSDALQAKSTSGIEIRRGMLLPPGPVESHPHYTLDVAE